MGSIYSVLLKDKYVNEIYKEEILNYFCELGFSEENIFLRVEKGVGIGSYVFIVSENFLKNWDKLKRKKCFESDKYFCLEEEEFYNFISEVDFVERDVSYGDVVYIKNGVYSGLYGIALLEKENFVYTIGIKMCCGQNFFELKRGDFDIHSNLFNYLKVPKNK